MTDQPFKIGFVLFEQLTQLDLMGPLQVLSRLPGAEVHLAAKSLEPIGTDCGVSLNPTIRLEDCPDLDLLCVPGGYGINEVIHDPGLLDLVGAHAAAARYVTSVCTGAFVLGWPVCCVDAGQPHTGGITMHCSAWEQHRSGRGLSETEICLPEAA